MPINAHPEYIAAEGEYLKAQSLEEKIDKLKKMISFAPSHKGGENLRAQLRTRLKKLLEQQEKSSRSGKSSSKTGIKKEDMQCVIIGKTNSGKSSLLKALTGTHQKISELKFTTTKSQVSMMDYNTVQIQMIEIPAIDSESFDKGTVYTSDTVVIVAESIDEIKEILDKLKTSGKIILVINKSDKLSDMQKRKISETLKSKYKKYPFVIISASHPDITKIEELKKMIFNSFDICRIYTKQPGSDINKAKQRPMILPPNSTIKDVAEKILKGFSSRIIQTRIWGPSSKFSGQIVGLKHKVKDLDVVEFKTK